MHTSGVWFEKISSGKYRFHCIGNNPEQIIEVKKIGCTASIDNPDEYIKDYSIDDLTLNFGVTMADCFNQLQDNQGFITALVHMKSLRPIGAATRKEMEDNLTETEMLGAMLEMQSLDEFLFSFADNYSGSLVEEGNIYLGKGLDEFAKWLRSGSVRFKKDPKDVADDFVIDRKKFRSDNCINVYIGCGNASLNPEAYKDWKDRFDNDECWMEFIRSCIDPTDETHDQEFYFACYNYFSSNKAADDLFEILNKEEPCYSIQTKRLIYSVLKSRSQEDGDFARELQRKFDDYKRFYGGIDITFEIAGTDETVKETQLIPQIEKPATKEMLDVSSLDKTAQQVTNDSEIQDFKDSTATKKAKELYIIIDGLLDGIAGRENEFLNGYDLGDLKGIFESILIANASEYKEIQRAIIDELSGTDNNRITPQYYHRKRLWLQPFFIIIGRLFNKGVLRKGKQRSLVKALFPDKRDKDPKHGIVYKEDFDFIESCRNKISTGNQEEVKGWKEKFEWIDKCL